MSRKEEVIAKIVALPRPQLGELGELGARCLRVSLVSDVATGGGVALSIGFTSSDHIVFSTDSVWSVFSAVP